MLFEIALDLLPKSHHKYLHYNNEIDIIGQIMIQMEYNVEGKHKIPSDLGLYIHPFTIEVRKRIVDTKLTLDILALDMFLPTRIHHIKTQLPKLLEPHGMEVKFI
jgi:hypothetical protein